MKLKLHQNVIGTAIVYLHQYSRRHSFRYFDKFLVGTTALFLASKVENSPVSLEKIIRLYYSSEQKVKRIQNTQMTEHKLFQYKEKFCEAEAQILRDIGFDVEVILPYPYFDAFCQYFASAENSGPNELNQQQKIMMEKQKQNENALFFKIAYNFCNDSLKTPVCLFYHPALIATACIYMTHIYLKTTLPHNWFKLLHPDIEFSVIKEIAQHIKKLYMSKIQKTVKKVDEESLNLSQKTQQASEQQSNTIINNALEANGSISTITSSGAPTPVTLCTSKTEYQDEPMVSISEYASCGAVNQEVPEAPGGQATHIVSQFDVQADHRPTHTLHAQNTIQAEVTQTIESHSTREMGFKTGFIEKQEDFHSQKTTAHVLNGEGGAHHESLSICKPSDGHEECTDGIGFQNQNGKRVEGNGISNIQQPFNSNVNSVVNVHQSN